MYITKMCFDSSFQQTATKIPFFLNIFTFQEMKT